MPAVESRYDFAMPTGLQRYQSTGQDHFITFTCYHRQPLLRDSAACSVVEATLERLRARHGFYLYGYVLMPDHVHLLISEPKQHLLADTMRALKTETAKQLKGEREHFWQQRYYDRNIITQREFVEKLRYIHRNPVKAGLVEEPEAWPWSSFQHWLSGAVGRVEIESHWTWSQREAGASHSSR